MRLTTKRKQKRARKSQLPSSTRAAPVSSVVANPRRSTICAPFTQTPVAISPRMAMRSALSTLS